jgi:DNA-binding MarR family transcriptional regulator
MIDPDVFAVLRAYPQIYHACHVEHRSRAASPDGLTSHDASLLAHVEIAEGISPARLARHLGVAPSTLSAALARLARQGMVAMAADPADARRRLVRLTDRGSDALATGSVLDPGRLTAVMAQLQPAERQRAVDGLNLLAGAARAWREQGRC